MSEGWCAVHLSGSGMTLHTFHFTRQWLHVLALFVAGYLLAWAVEACGPATVGLAVAVNEHKYFHPSSGTMSYLLGCLFSPRTLSLP